MSEQELSENETPHTPFIDQLEEEWNSPTDGEFVSEKYMYLLDRFLTQLLLVEWDNSSTSEALNRLEMELRNSKNVNPGGEKGKITRKEIQGSNLDPVTLRAFLGGEALEKVARLSDGFHAMIGDILKH